MIRNKNTSYLASILQKCRTIDQTSRNFLCIKDIVIASCRVKRKRQKGSANDKKSNLQ